MLLRKPAGHSWQYLANQTGISVLGSKDMVVFSPCGDREHQNYPSGAGDSRVHLAILRRP